MTPKEEAIELVNIYFTTCHKSSDLELSWKVCKQCAIIAVNKIIDNIPYGFYSAISRALKITDLEYWQQVKTEIEKL